MKSDLINVFNIGVYETKHTQYTTLCFQVPSVFKHICSSVFVLQKKTFFRISVFPLMCMARLWWA